MNSKERQRKAVCEMVKQGQIKLTKASEQCDVSYDHMLRIYKRYIEEGDAGLIHKNRGRLSNRKHPHQTQIINRYKERYEGFGPTLASEYLEADGYIVNHETLRKWLLKEGIWCKQRKRSPYRKKREPKAQFGELVQIDGSIHDWFEEGKHTCLLNMVDDATTTSLAILDSGETTGIVLEGLKAWILKYGIPLALYVDLKNVYVSNKNRVHFTHVEIACQKLGIRIIKAYSPQAKGRVERNHAVYQDRFVKELKLQNIKTFPEANALLENGFVDHLNNKFAKLPRNPASAHRALGDTDLNQILCWRYERQMQHDWTFSFNGKYYQVEKHPGDLIKPKVLIEVRRHLDGSFSAWYNDNKLDVKAIDTKPKQEKRPVKRKAYPSMPSMSWRHTNHNLFK